MYKPDSQRQLFRKSGKTKKPRQSFHFVENKIRFDKIEVTEMSNGNNIKRGIEINFYEIRKRKNTGIPKTRERFVSEKNGGG